MTVHTLVSIIVPSRGRSSKLQSLLDALAAQALPESIAIEVIVVIDGDGDRPVLPDGLAGQVIEVEFGGAANARNVGIKQSSGEILLFMNDDVMPDQGCVQAHVAAISKGHRAVVGDSPWASDNEQSLFDVFIAHTPSVFDARSLVPHGLHDFRSAWTLNFSILRSAIEGINEPFNHEIRPVYFEDLEFAFRCLGTDPVIYYEPAARVVHHHRVCIGEYFKREILLGMMSAVLFEHNRDCHDAIFRITPKEHASIAEPMLKLDAPDHRRLFSVFTDRAHKPASVYQDPIAESQLLHTMHLPIKRRAFRLGLCAEINRGGIDWDQRIAIAADLYRNDQVFGQPAINQASPNRAEPTHA
ncbi:MAG: glycosyltransferase [Phycisphaerales bacterium]|nr:glycosyltransferase [Phycisphaerales bacterium]